MNNKRVATGRSGASPDNGPAHDPVLATGRCGHVYFRSAAWTGLITG